MPAGIETIAGQPEDLLADLAFGGAGPDQAALFDRGKEFLSLGLRRAEGIRAALFHIVHQSLAATDLVSV